MQKITCTGRDGIARYFYYKASPDPLASPARWTFRVNSQPPPQGGEFFELVVEEIDSQTVRVVMANHFNRQEYVAMGIPDALLPVIKNELGVDVQSSPKEGPGNIYRTSAATKYWQRLQKTGLATYDCKKDIYTVA